MKRKRSSTTMLVRVMTMLLMMLSAMGAWADIVPYFDPTAEQDQQMKQVDDATIISTQSTTLTTGWYYVGGNTEITVNGRITVNGTVNLILADGCKFHATCGIRVSEGNTLNIYAQSAGEGCGVLHAEHVDNDAAIGGDGGLDDDGSGSGGTSGENAGTISIYGGNIKTSGNIGGGNGGNGGHEEIEPSDPGGEPSDPGSEPSSGTGINSCGGMGGACGTISIYGGMINVDGTIGGGNGGDGGSGQGELGDGTINLSWTSSNTDKIYAWGYNGTVTLQKSFMDTDGNPVVVDEDGHPIDVFDIGYKTIVPATAVFFYPQKDPTCTEVGYAQDYWFNVANQKWYTDEACTELAGSDGSNPEIPALGHQYEHVVAKPATFTTNGNSEHWTCTRCQKCFKQDENNYIEIDPAGIFFGVQGNATDGYYMLMPQNGTQTLTLDESVTSFRIYDNGGEGGSNTDSDVNGNYSDYCDGKLVLIAPDGYAIQLTGNIISETGYDYLSVYAGTTTGGDVLLDRKWSDAEEVDDGNGGTNRIPVLTSIGKLNSKNMTLHFYSEDFNNYAGLDLTATLLPSAPHDINIVKVGNGEIACPASASVGEKVTLTATPGGDNLLSGITVKIDGTDDEVEVTGGTWYNPTATFIMPNNNVTVTATFSDDKSNLSINMPKTGTATATFPTGVTSFKIYDDGGVGGSNEFSNVNGNYSDYCNGKLVLTAPEGYTIQLTGTISSEEGTDHLTVYAGTTTDGNVLLDHKSGLEQEIGALYSANMTLYFHSDIGANYVGLDLTATLVQLTPHDITIVKVGDGEVVCPASASVDEEVTLTVTPTAGRLLRGITVKIDGTDDEVEVTGGTWYNPTTTFIMPNNNVTVTATFSDDTDNLFINMSKTGTTTVTIPSIVTSFKIYDDAGNNYDYSSFCDGNLVLIAPENKVIQLTGTVQTEENCDYLTVYGGMTSGGDKLLNQACGYYMSEGEPEMIWYDASNIGVLSGTSMTLNFHSDSGIEAAGLDLTATLLSIENGEVKVDGLSYMRGFVGPEDYAPDATIDGVDVTVYTVCLPHKPTADDGIKYYTLSGATATSLQFTEVTEVEANKPYLMAVSESMSWNIIDDDPVTLKKECDGPTAGGFKFVGTHLGLSNAEAVTKGAYILQDGNVWGQVQAATSEHPEYGNAYIPAYRAFIVPVGAGAPIRIGTDFEEGNATEIQSLQLIDKDGTENWYDLNGHRIERPTQRGIYINNGKKVMIK